MKTAEEFMTFSQANVEAFVKSSQIMATGLQDMGKQMAATAQASFDEAMSTFRAMSGVRSIKEAIDLQTSLAKSHDGEGRGADEPRGRDDLQARRAGDRADREPFDGRAGQPEGLKPRTAPVV